MVRSVWRVAIAVCAIAALPGCDILGLGETERVGTLQYHGDSTVVWLPASAAVDSTFAVRFHTFGGGCVSADRTELDVAGGIATVTPIDKDSGASTCTAESRFLQHEALVRFSAVGRATVVVRGVEEPGGGEVELTFPIVVERR